MLMASQRCFADFCSFVISMVAPVAARVSRTLPETETYCEHCERKSHSFSRDDITPQFDFSRGMCRMLLLPWWHDGSGRLPARARLEHVIPPKNPDKIF